MFSFLHKSKDPVSFCFHTDIHCHVLPGLDDGSPDVTTSLQLVQRMRSWGIDKIIATPHVTAHKFENNAATISPALNALKDELRSSSVPMDVSHSAEYRIDDLLLAHLQQGKLMPFPNDYILIENSFIQEPWNLNRVVFDLQVKGYRPVLAHPERYIYYYGDTRRYEELRAMGLMFQINILSLAGAYGSREGKVARELIRRGMVDFAGTDLHRTAHADAIDNYLVTKQAREDMAALADLVRNDVAFV